MLQSKPAALLTTVCKYMVYLTSCTVCRCTLPSIGVVPDP